MNADKFLPMSGNQDQAPWDRRLTDRWARQAREAANDPERNARTPFREQVRSPYYWMTVTCVVGVWVINLSDASG